MSLHPFKNNPMQTKSDYQKLVNDLFEPLLPYFKTQGALLDFGDGAASFDMKASSLEGVARCLWGIIPLEIGGGEFKYWDVLRSAIVEGTDPNHMGYWGPTGDFNQRSVEMAAIGLLLAALPERCFSPLTEKQQINLLHWLSDIQKYDMPQNNWLFFTLLVQEGLSRVGYDCLVDLELQREYQQRLDSWYLGDGWYCDGKTETIDHYAGFAMHYYGLIYEALLSKGTEKKYVPRAHKFAKTFQHWFSEEGDTLVIGRSLTYRFAAASFWGALALDKSTRGENSMSLSEVKGIWARHMRWWKDKPIFTDGGLLTRGYAYPNLMMCEVYNSPTSPYWAMKAFIPLALSDDSEFWQVQESPMSIESGVYTNKTNQTLVQRVDGHSIVHYGAPVHTMFQKDKYNKFTYSTFGGLDVNSLLYSEQGSFGDHILAFSFDKGTNWQYCQKRISSNFPESNKLETEWFTGELTVSTVTEAFNDGSFIRTHTFTLEKHTRVIETGFSIGQWYEDANVDSDEANSGRLQSYPKLKISGSNGCCEMSSIDNYEKYAITSLRVHTDVSFPRSLVPGFITELAPGTHVLKTRFFMRKI